MARVAVQPGHTYIARATATSPKARVTVVDQQLTTTVDGKETSNLTVMADRHSVHR